MLNAPHQVYNRAILNLIAIELNPTPETKALDDTNTTGKH